MVKCSLKKLAIQNFTKNFEPKYKLVLEIFLIFLSIVQTNSAHAVLINSPREDSNISVVSPSVDVKDRGQIQFDSDLLRLRGIPPQVAEYFKSAARFPPGENIIEVSVNGTRIGRHAAMFSSNGTLCSTPNFLKSVGLINKENNSYFISTTELQKKDDSVNIIECIDFSTVFLQTVVSLDPTNGIVEITTPAENVEVVKSARVETGGRAALLNYRFSTSQSSYEGAPKSSFTQVDTLAGFNWDDWIVRSQQSYSFQNGQTIGRFSGAFAQKTFVEKKQILQGGLIWTQNPLYSGVPFAGAQWIPEFALNSTAKYPITGVAGTRARVEVKQNGIVLLSTVVPPGPFALTEYQQASLTSDLQVKVTEENGAEQNFVIPSSSLLLAGENLVDNGIYASAGLLWDASASNNIRSIPMVTAAKNWKPSPSINLTMGGLLTPHYASVGAATNTKVDLLGKVNLYGQVIASRDNPDNATGAMGSAAALWSKSDEFQVGVSGNVRTAGYRSVQQAESGVVQIGAVVASGPYAQIGTNLRWNSKSVGSFNASLTHQTYFGAPASNSYSAGWSSAIGAANLSVSFTHNSQNNSANSSAGRSNSSNSVYASLNMPLGPKTSTSTYVRQASDSGKESTHVSTSLEHKVNDSFTVRVTTEKALSDPGQPDIGISASVIPRYTSLSFGVSSGPGRTSYYAEASGGIVFSSQGLSFSPSAVQDTFGVVKLGDVAGIMLQTSSGNVWSGYNGLAAVPGLSPFQDSRVEIDGSSLSAEVDVEQGAQVVRAGRGAFVDMAMKVTKVRRVLLTVTYKEDVLPAGMAIVRDQNNFFTMSSKNGFVMMTDWKDEEKYSAQLSDDKSCTFKNIQMKPRVTGDFFERGTAVCE